MILSTDDRSRALSESDRSIIRAFSAHPRIINISAEDREYHLRVTLATVCAYVGIKEEPSDEMVGLMMEFLLKKFQHSTFGEIISAVECNLAGELPEKIEHYQACDIPYITSLLIAYQARKRQAFTELRKLRDDKAPKERKTATPLELYAGLLLYLKNHDEFPNFWNWSAVFDHMWTEKLFKATKEEMLEWFKNESTIIREAYFKELSTAVSQVEKNAIYLLLEDGAVRAECRKRYVQLSLK